MILIGCLLLLGLIVVLFKRKADRDHEFKQSEKELFMRKHIERINKEDGHHGYTKR